MKSETGATGERGDSGDRGVAGERGPKGDHGQQGDHGQHGDMGLRGRDGGVALFLVTCAFVFGGWLLGEKHGCQRTQGTRATVRVLASAAQEVRRDEAKRALADGRLDEYRIDMRAYRRYQTVVATHPISCGWFFPDTK